ncbi:protein kinase domain-containing protein [Ktedonospora formicarum]|uniref:Protein kinase domain-containing protein n=1 Tax=Ktedonospora formicarum TaxID=2778364 RepID=A0A8J3MTP8_9CHLR|nr:protein kinase [Ktedonospora formicarum]GHO46151.1 hypothetical protein KSX_43140 [Ktedonospora formicarum]
MTDDLSKSGDTTLGNYRLIELIGRGGFADVYLGEHIYLKTQAAIKVLLVHLDRDALEQFLTEARIIAHLAHPHIVPVLEFGIEQTTPYLVMAYAPHGSLHQRYPPGCILPPVEVASYVRQVASALQYAHDHNIIHRDVKPGNMLLGQGETVLLSDFGIAVKAQTRLTEDRQENSGKAAGTTTYMAPEQIGANPTYASDQYALAVVTYEWLCGSLPFTGAPMEIAYKHVNAPIPSLREKLPSLSVEIEQVVMRALSKSAQERFARVQDFADALLSACQRAPQRASSPSLLSRQTSNLYDERLYATGTVSNIAPFLPSAPTNPSTPGKQFRMGAPVSGSGNQFRMAPHTSGSQFRTSYPNVPQPQPQKLINRRTLMLGATGVVSLGIVLLGAGALWQNAQQHTPPPTQGQKKPAATPTKAKPTPDLAATAQASIMSLTSRPTAVVSSPGHSYLLVRGANDALWLRTFDGSWHPWEPLNGTVPSDPAITAWGEGHLDILGRAADNTLHYTWFDGSWHPWQALDGAIVSDPAAVSWGPNRLDVFVRGPADALWHRAYDGTWYPWDLLGGTITTAPAACSWGANRLDVVARGTDNALWYKGYDGTWHEWFPLGGAFSSDPTITTWGVGRLDIFARGMDNTLQHAWYDGSWHPWESLGGALATAPSAISWGGNYIEVFARATDNTLQHTWFDGSWHPWEPLPR